MYFIKQLLKKLSFLSHVMILLAAATGIANSTFAQQQWRAVGKLGFSDGQIQHTNIAIDRNNIPYAVFSDNGVGGFAYDGKVMKYDGSKWVTIGHFPQTQYMAIAIDASNNPYVVFADGAVGNKATVMKYNGSTWSVVGWQGISALNVYHNDITIDKNNNPLITHLDDGFKSEVTALRYSGGWGEIGIPSYSAAYWPIFNHIAVDGNNVPYVTFTDRNNGNKATVIRYSAGKWSLVGPNGISAGLAQYTDIAIDGNNVPYVVYADSDSSYRAFVKKYDGTQWVTVGGAAATTNRAHETRIAIDGNNVPYIVYSDWGDTAKTKVMTYDGSKWVNVGLPGNTASVGATNYTSIAIDGNNIPYILYLDYSESQKATVMKYGCISPTQAQLCGVLTDPSTAKNIILWDTTGVQHADSYRIFREDTVGYQQIGSVSASVIGMYIDMSATPSKQSYKYKIAVVDSCGVGTPLSASTAQQTIHLGFYSTGDNRSNLVWNAYTGVSSPSYNVLRSVDGSAYTGIGTVTTTGYTDTNPPASGNVTYRVEVAAPGCISGMGYSSITSNVAAAWAVNIPGLELANDIIIIPNPAHDYVTISFTSSTLATEVNILNATGQVVYKQQVPPATNSLTVPLGEIPHGMYMVEVNTQSGKRVSKLVKR
jgi:hypothetical protein